MKHIVFLAVLALLSLTACGGGDDPGSTGGTPAPPPSPPPSTQDQIIVFATPGSVSAAVGVAVTNTASGGGGSGAISYASSNVSVATVNSANGVATLLMVGSTTITATKAASSGFNQATASYTLNITQGTQTISFAQAGPLLAIVGATITNTASGGAGTGAISYASSIPSAVTVNSSSGVASAVAAGTATITATKAADTNYSQAQATYTITVAAGSGGVDMGATRIPLVDLGLNIYNPALQAGGGYQGGLYAGGSNTMPAAHHAAGVAKATAVQLLDQNGNPSSTGKIVLLSIGMSNTTEEFCVAAHATMTCGGSTGRTCNTPSGNRWQQNCHATSFMGQAALEPGLNPNLVIVNGAAGMRTAPLWISPTATTDSQGNGFDDYSMASGTPVCGATDTVFDNQYDRIRHCVLPAVGVTEAQVQVAWVKVANGGPTRHLATANVNNNADKADAYCQTRATPFNNTQSEAANLQEQLGCILRTLKVRYPNIKQVLVSSRIYGGYATIPLNPEPYAYQYGFSVKWAIDAQIRQAAGQPIDTVAKNLSYDNVTGVAPWVAWGPYLWANGTTPVQTGGLIPDVAGLRYFPFVDANGDGNHDAGLPAPDLRADNTHPSLNANPSGQQKVGNLLNRFFNDSPLTRCWFRAGETCQ